MTFESELRYTVKALGVYQKYENLKKKIPHAIHHGWTFYGSITTAKNEEGKK